MVVPRRVIIRQFPVCFTLIELLVVIAIIAVLASMLLPVLSAAREKGLSVSCMGQQRQLGMGFEMYMDSESDQFFPHASGSSVSWRPVWFIPVARAMSIPGAPDQDTTLWSPPRKSILWCPRARVDGFVASVWYLSYSYPYGGWSDRALGGPFYGWSGLGPRRHSEVQVPERTTLLVEMVNNAPGVSSHLWGSSLLRWEGPTINGATWHFGRHGREYQVSNFLYVDGHVEPKLDGRRLTAQFSPTADPYNFDMR